MALLAALAVAGMSAPAAAQTAAERFEEAAPGVGRMATPMPDETDIGQIDDRLRFEPWQLVDEMFLRDDVVFLMRHGPTDWSVRDPKRVDPSDCGKTRVLSAQGWRDMTNFGALLAYNEVLPSRILVSEWCRNQQTVDAMLAGARGVDAAATADIEVRTEPALNLLLHLDGAPNVSGMRRIVSSWDGPEEGDGPLLLVSHYTNIEELTEFRVYEGEVLVLDPDRDNRVLGYLRLESAGPDVGHFDVPGESAAGR